MLEIALLVFGIIALIKGQVWVGKDRYAYGAPARIAGFIFMVPLPLALAFAVILVVANLHRIEDRNFEDEMTMMVTLVELGLVVICGLIGFGIAKSYAEPKRDAQWRPARRASDDILGPRTAGSQDEEPADYYDEPRGRHGDFPADPRYRT